MAPLPPPEPARLLETTAALDARKIRFELNRIVLPIGLEATFGVIRHPGASLAVPVLDDGRVVLLRQYRFAVASRILEFPAGTLDEGEDPLSTMQRELQEDLSLLADQPAGDDDEDLEVLLMTPAELDAALASGDEALDGKSVTAWFRARQLLGL